MALCVVPWNLVVPGESPFTLALDTIHIPYASTIMSWIILTAVLSFVLVAGVGLTGVGLARIGACLGRLGVRGRVGRTGVALRVFDAAERDGAVVRGVAADAVARVLR